jgi:hypothetical protein
MRIEDAIHILDAVDRALHISQLCSFPLFPPHTYHRFPPRLPPLQIRQRLRHTLKTIIHRLVQYGHDFARREQRHHLVQDLLGSRRVFACTS